MTTAEPELRLPQRYRCELESVSGMYAQYSGHVDVWCANEEDLFARAVRELQRTAFPDRSAACWRLVGYSLLK